ncbi:MAG TPA: helix-turn-helix domain-containing protein [Pseudonocardia sp.]|jgi:AraC-like DNA-binding protein|nr:helix-turn-helix domain-containing protein [Pseudonocardia sp.]
MAVWDVTRCPAPEQFDYWREVICQAFVPLTPTRRVDEVSFSGQVETRPLGTLNRAALRSQAQDTLHGPKEVSRTSGEYYFVNLQLEGVCRVVQSGVESFINPGQFTVVDTTEPYAFTLDSNWSMLSYRVPRGQISTRLARPRSGLATPIETRSGVGAVASSLMRSLWQLGDVAGPEAAAELADSFAAAVAAALSSIPGATPGTALSSTPATSPGTSLSISGQPVRERSLQAGIRTAILGFVRQNVSNPDLSVSLVCRHFSISPRTLHKLFQERHESFSATVRSIRLERCARLLADSTCVDSITEIAARNGFSDPASFSRAFRRRYGMAPREMRWSVAEERGPTVDRRPSNRT